MPVFVTWSGLGNRTQLFQFHGLANKPAAAGVDHRILAQKKSGSWMLPSIRVTRHFFIEDFKLHGHHRFEQPRERRMLIYLFQRQQPTANAHMVANVPEREGGPMPINSSPVRCWNTCISLLN